MTDNRNYKSKYHQAAIIQKLGLPTTKQKFMKSRKSMTMCVLACGFVRSWTAVCFTFCQKYLTAKQA